jgi:hypothetical protein
LVEASALVEPSGFERNIAGLPAARAGQVSCELLVEDDDGKVVNRYARLHGL